MLVFELLEIFPPFTWRTMELPNTIVLGRAFDVSGNGLSTTGTGAFSVGTGAFSVVVGNAFLFA